MAMTILTEQQLHKTAPAIFAQSPDHQVSERYGFVPTIEVVRALQGEGWYPVRAMQTQARDGAKAEHSRHLIRFRPDPDRQIHIDDCTAELVLTNSHDRSAAYQLDLGLYRFVCDNGLVTQTGDLGGLRVKHGKHIVQTLLSGSLDLLRQAPDIAHCVADFQSTLISKAEALWLAQAALRLRYGDQWQANSPIQPHDLLQARRAKDQQNSLWKVFNRIQENLMKGGLSGYSAQSRRVRTRAVQSVSEEVRLNRGLWQLTHQLSQLKDGQSLATPLQHPSLLAA